MKIINSYIFIPRKEENKKNEIKLGEYFPTVFHDYFKVTSSDELKSIVSLNNRINTGIFNYKNINIEYKILNVDSVYYLDIIIDETKKSIVNCLTDFNTIFLNEAKFNKKYIPIISYDFVSENYCNKVYPILNKFERKFRKLLFLIFTSNFKELYFEKIAPKEMIEKVKGNIRIKNNQNKEEYRIQNYFYSIDIGTLRELLFNKNWTLMEEEQKNKLLNEDLSNMTEEEIKNKIKEIEPKSNWERFFYNKGFSDDIEDMMKSINELRNVVAHNRILNENDYLFLKINLEKLIDKIDKAIMITESVDFMEINNNKYRKLFSSITKSINNIIDQIGINDYTIYLDWFKNYTNSILDMQNSIVKGIMDSIDTINKKDLK